MAAKIKSGDLVKVIRGKDRGKEGTVKQVLKDDRLIVEGVQIVKKHVRATQQGQQAGIVAVEAPIHRSNVMVIDPETKQPTRVRIVEKEEARDGKVKTVRVRVAKKSGKELASNAKRLGFLLRLFEILSLAAKQKPCLWLLLQDCFEDAEKPGMIFLLAETANVANHKAVLQPQFRPHLFSYGRGKGKTLAVYSIDKYPEWPGI